MKKKKHNRCGKCKYLTDTRVGTIDHLCVVLGYGVPDNHSCNAWKNKVSWYKRARLCVANFFRGVRYFFKYPRG